MQFQQYRHHRLGQLAAQAALTGEVEVLDQLLGQGTATLAHRSGRGIDPHGPGDGFGRHAQVTVEIAVFGGHKGFEQVLGHLVDLDQDAILQVLGVDAADHQRLQPHHIQGLAVGARQSRHVITGEPYTDELGRLHALIELEPTCIEVHRVAVHRCRAWPIGGTFTAITQRVEFGEEVVLAQFLAGEQLQRPGIHLGGDSPALAGKLFLHDGIEVDREASDDHQADQAELQSPAQPGTGAAGRAFFGGTGISRSSHGGGLYALY